MPQTWEALGRCKAQTRPNPSPAPGRVLFYFVSAPEGRREALRTMQLERLLELAFIAVEDLIQAPVQMGRRDLEEF